METGIKFVYRNTNHWDVLSREMRIARIRGERNGHTIVIPDNDYSLIPEKDGLKDDIHAMKYVLNKICKRD